VGLPVFSKRECTASLRACIDSWNAYVKAQPGSAHSGAYDTIITLPPAPNSAGPDPVDLGGSVKLLEKALPKLDHGVRYGPLMQHMWSMCVAATYNGEIARTKRKRTSRRFGERLVEATGLELKTLQTYKTQGLQLTAICGGDAGEVEAMAWLVLFDFKQGGGEDDEDCGPDGCGYQGMEGGASAS